jgi:hypothetical protein
MQHTGYSTHPALVDEARVGKGRDSNRQGRRDGCIYTNDAYLAVLRSLLRCAVLWP